MGKKLKKEIIQDLTKKFEITEGSARTQISEIRRTYPVLTLNAAAQFYARKKGKSILAKLDKEDRESLSKVPIDLKQIIVTKSQKHPKNIRILTFLKYDSKDYFQGKHIEEINRTYTFKCFTATFILCRKVIENLIIDLLIKQFPEQNNRRLYFDINRRRFHDFSLILKNLYDKRSLFPPTAIKPIERLYVRAKLFAKDANDKTHSWFHVVSKKELDDINIQEIIYLIQSINKIIA